MNYQAPAVRDYGTVVEMTEALGISGSEDGMSKMVPIHHNPLPSIPIIP